MSEHFETKLGGELNRPYDTAVDKQGLEEAFQSPATVQPFHDTHQSGEAEPANTLSWAIDLLVAYEQRLIDLGDPEHLVRSEVQKAGLAKAKQVLAVLRTLRNGTGWDGIIDAYKELRDQGYSHESAKMNAPMQYGFKQTLERQV